MATTRGKGTTGTRTAADPSAEAAPRARGTRTRAPEDEISGVAAPVPAADLAPMEAPAAPKTRGGPKKRETYTETAARRKREKEVDQLKADLRAFASAKPGGWNHDDWVSFLAHLAERGHDTSNDAEIGARLERERLSVVLEGINGLGPRRVQSLVDRFHTLWSMRRAHPQEIAAVSGMTRPLAERVAQELAARYP
jgi:hypothetical protein